MHSLKTHDQNRYSQTKDITIFPDPGVHITHNTPTMQFSHWKQFMKLHVVSSSDTKGLYCFSFMQ